MSPHPDRSSMARFAAVVATALTGLSLLTASLAAQTLVSFPAKDSGVVYADEYGAGTNGVILVHGARFDRTSWNAQAVRLDSAGFHVLAVDLRGHGLSRGPSSTPPRIGYPLDVLASVDYLRAHGASRITLVGASMGGWAAAHAQFLFGTDQGPRLMREILEFLSQGGSVPSGSDSASGAS